MDEISEKHVPLAERMRPEKWEDFVGQDEIVGPGKPLRLAIEKDELVSVIFWGPPGSGKSSLAQIIAQSTQAYFVKFSAVATGISELKKVVDEAEIRYQMGHQRTILFIDEIHRWNKSQQDALLPYVENGTVVLIGATTENPSFEIISPLLSRSRVYLLNPLSKDDIRKILRRALLDKNKGLGRYKIKIESEAAEFLLRFADGDARVALNALELAVLSAPVNYSGERYINQLHIKEVFQKSNLRYDKKGEEHYNLISALHKSLRDSNDNASLYWLVRMLEAGEDPLYIARRLVRFASEDIGNADNQALQIAVSAMEAVKFVGSPEGNLALVQAVIYLARAPKSNLINKAYHNVKSDIEKTGSLPVPLHLRNPETKLMEEIGYGRNYKYAYNYPNAQVKQEHLPPELRDKKWL